MATRKDALRCTSRAIAGDGRRDLPLGAIRRRILAWSSHPVMLGMGDQVGLYVKPFGTLLELLSEGGLHIGLAGKAPIPQMPQRLLPVRVRLLHLSLQRRPRPLFAGGGPHHYPAFFVRRLGR